MSRADDLIRAVREAATIGEVVAALFVDDDPILTAYTEADLAAREAAAKAAAEAERQAKADAEARAQADRERDSFALNGSDRTADVAAAAGQNDMFGATPASDPTSLLDGQPTVTSLRPEGRENVVKTAKGTKVSTAFHVVEASDLVVSHDAEGKENPAYPQALQPRDRGRLSSQAWVQKTSKDLDPDMLGRTRRADTGAPIVGPDAIVESGNGRTMAIRQAYKEGRAEEYREWLLDEAATFGLNPDKIKAMREPVLVRVRTSDVDRAAFAVEANQDDKLSMTATEKARSDARRLTPELMAQFAPGSNGDLLAASNRGFIRGFL